MRITNFIAVGVAVAFLVASASSSASPDTDKVVPSFDYNDLLNALNGLSDQQGVIERVAEVSRTFGSFLIKNLPDGRRYSAAVESLQTEAATCFESETLEKVVSLKVSPSVIRSTSAVSSENPSSDHPSCIRPSADVIKKTFDTVGNVVHQLIDRISESRSSFRLAADESVQISSSPNLDHIHLYASTGDQDEPTATLHTDNGLFLLATPSAESPLHVVDSDGVAFTTLTAEPAIVVLFGRAMDHWLLKSEDKQLFRAAPHFVPAFQSGKQRVIFARMYVAPKEAVPMHGSRVEFGQFFMEVEDNQLSTSNLCPSLRSSHRSAASAPAASAASALLWRSARNSMCDEGSDYCWMACLPLDSSCPASQQSCYNNQHQACCIEGQTWADGCLDMDVNCQWHCN